LHIPRIAKLNKTGAVSSINHLEKWLALMADMLSMSVRNANSGIRAKEYWQVLPRIPQVLGQTNSI